MLWAEAGTSAMPMPGRHEADHRVNLVDLLGDAGREAGLQAKADDLIGEHPAGQAAKQHERLVGPVAWPAPAVGCRGELRGRPGELGVVKTGALADLLLVEDDPLAGIEILQDRGALRMIMKDGQLNKAP
jgi:hypothetical protein